ncbi:MAG: carboxy terminal-processing peptidase [Akkermansia sp.]|nr:carboxy terminal-processing peptidase [Akkermansia sp.]MBQ8377271.1 carboxy terminal-processing peptidase [Akkermansia sp.]
MNTFIANWKVRARALGMAAAAALVSCTSISQAEPDYDIIGKQFSLVLQNAHFSRARFSQDLYQQFLDCYVQSLDMQHLFLTQEDVEYLRNRYASSFGDYLLANQTTRLAEELYAYFSERALPRIAQAEKLLQEYATQMPAFDSTRTVPRSRRKLPRAKDAAELDQVWRDQVEDMILTEVLRRENLAELAAAKGKPSPVAKEMSVTDKMLARIKRMRNEIQEADREDMVSYLLNAVAHVYDPHSDYMGAREEQRFKDMIKASIVGIGAKLQSDDDGSTTIEGIVKGGPAAKCGQLQLGDHIVAVAQHGDDNWTDVMFLSIDKVVDLIRGQKGEAVKLRVQSADTGEEKVVTIVRDEIPMSEELASGRIIDMKDGDRTYRLGVLTLPSFYIDLDDGDVHCAADVKKLLRRMMQEKVEGIVLDLRFNGGGSLDEVRKMVGFFTGAGPVVQVKDSRAHVERLTVSGRPLYNGQLVVIINKLSASASEIFAGAMADYGRAVIVGDEASYGKGTVQVPRGLADYMPYFTSREGCGMIKVTTQKFYRVGGASTQLKGVSSDIVLPTVTAGLRLGEGEQDYAMPYDEIPRAGGYVKSSRISRILPELMARSKARMAQDKDMQYTREDIERARERQEKNIVSLNKAERQAENAQLLERKKSIDAERKVRYEKMAADDEKNLTIYRLKLADVKLPKLPIASKDDDDEYMDENEDPEDELTETPEYPSKLDPVLREALHIVKDMVNMP